MALIQSWGDYLERRGEAAADSITQAQDAGMGLICGLHYKYPDKWFMTRFTRGLLNGLCSSIDLPTPRARNNFPGGQCFGTYRVIGRVFNDQGTFVSWAAGGGSPNIPGKVVGLEYPNDLSTSLDFMATYIQTEGGPEFTITVRPYQTLPGDPVVPTGTPVFPNAAFTGIVVDDLVELEAGQDCGTADLEYDPSPTVDSDDLGDTITIVNYNNQGDVIGGSTIDIDVDYDGIDFNFPTVVNIGGDKWTFGGDGVSDDSDSVGGPTSTTKKFPFAPSDYKRTFKDNDNPDETEDPTPVEEEEAEDVNVVWALVRIVTIPNERKIIYGKAAVDTTYFGGYFRWTMSTPSGIYSFDEQPLRKSEQVFRAPEEATGYRAYAINGATISVERYEQQTE